MPLRVVNRPLVTSKPLHSVKMTPVPLPELWALTMDVCPAEGMSTV